MYAIVLAVWAVSATQALLWQMITSTALWRKLSTNITGVVLRNILVLLFALPLPIVVVLMFLISCKAKKLLNRLAEGESSQLTPAYQRMKSDLRLLYSFGIVYILGYGLNFAVNVNSLINLSGYLNVVPDWKSSETFCQYLFVFDGLANILINFSNSVIVVQSRHVQLALKKMYQETSRIVRSFARGDITGERLIVEEDTS